MVKDRGLQHAAVNGVEDSDVTEGLNNKRAGVKTSGEVIRRRWSPPEWDSVLMGPREPLCPFLMPFEVAEETGIYLQLGRELSEPGTPAP